jgi:hypothetical protein
MTHTAQLVLTVICLVTALVSEVAGVTLAASELRHAQRTLREWDRANPQGNALRPLDQTAMLNGVIKGLLGNPFDRASAVVFLVLGAVLGAAGNFLSLTL